MEPKSRLFKKEVPVHLSRTHIRNNFRKNTWTAITKRNKAVSEVPHWEELREQAYQIKREIIDNLEENLAKFEANARKRGIEVLHAATAADANQLADDIARRHSVKSIVKSKSMVTEEIGFNHFMISKGYDVVETDLGEYIVQLAGETPSNLISPAMHMSRQDVAKLFAAKLGVEYREDPQFLTDIARNLLRDKFLSADMGVSGANFGIVENGAMVLVENEGNARMCTTVPKVHLAIIGIEKLIPRMVDLATFLTLLCRSGTGQKLTSYITTISGPRQPGEWDGAEHVYYILLDNSRRSFLEDEELKQALYCIRCSACYNTCPVYQNIGGHAYGWVYQGPIGSILTPQFLGLPNAKDLPYASSLCGSCSDICPVKIPLHHLLLHQRHRVVENNYTNALERKIMRVFLYMAKSAGRFQLAGKILRTVLKWLPGEPYILGWSNSRSFPKPPPQSFHEWWKNNRVKEGS